MGYVSDIVKMSVLRWGTCDATRILFTPRVDLVRDGEILVDCARTGSITSIVNLVTDAISDSCCQQPWWWIERSAVCGIKLPNVIICLTSMKLVYLYGDSGIERVWTASSNNTFWSIVFLVAHTYLSLWDCKLLPFGFCFKSLMPQWEGWLYTAGHFTLSISMVNLAWALLPSTQLYHYFVSLALTANSSGTSLNSYISAFLPPMACASYITNNTTFKICRSENMQDGGAHFVALPMSVENTVAHFHLVIIASV